MQLLASWVCALLLFQVPADRPLADLAPPAGYWVRVTADELNVRSRADMNATALVTVARGTMLRGVSELNGWHKVEPPASAFYYASAKYIESTSPTAGVVKLSEGSLRVRVGSSVQTVDPIKMESQTTLPNGAVVEIVGRDGDWYRIKAPADVYAYVVSDYVERVSDEQAMAGGAATPAPRRLEVRPVTDSATGAAIAPPPAGDGGMVPLGGRESSVPPEADGIPPGSALPALTSSTSIESNIPPASTPGLVPLSMPVHGSATSDLPPATVDMNPVPLRPLSAADVDAASGEMATSRPVSMESISSSQPSNLRVDYDERRMHWAYKLSEAEKLMVEESHRPAVNATWDPVLERLRPIAAQSEAGDIANVAQQRILDIQQRISNQDFLRRAEAAVRAQELMQGRTAEEWRTFQTVPGTRAPTPGPEMNFDARGILKLKPDRSSADAGNRSRLIDPFNGSVVAYVDLGDMQVKGLEHRWVGVRGDVTADDRGIKTIKVRDMQALTTTQIGSLRQR